MFKVLLVDDEPMAIEALKIGADWEEHGFKICGQCGNGEDALKIIDDELPDLIITDINMPVMDGLQLVKRVKENADAGDPVFIIVSGYDEFEYAKTAMQFGIQHYLLKPVFRDEFLEVLLKIIPELEKRKEYKNICFNCPEVDAGILFDKYLNGNLSQEMLAVNLDGEITAGSALWAYAILDTGFNVYYEQDTSNPNSFEIRCFEKIKKTIEIFGIEGFYIYPIFYNSISYGLILCSTGVEAPDELARYLLPELSSLCREGFYLSIGSPVEKLEYLSNSVREAEMALDYRFFSPDERILLYRDIKNYPINYSFDAIKYMDELLSAFESLDRQRINDCIRICFNIFRNSFIAPEIVEIYLTNVVYKSFSVIIKMGGIAEKIPDIPNISKLQDRTLSISEIEKLIEHYAIGFCDYAQSLKNKDKKSDRQVVEEYIRQNYKRNLTIREISGKLYLHPTYLGHQINKWFGCSYNEYLHKLRMEEAQRLIKETDLKVHEIALNLGYSTYSNFLEQFVRYFSLKPSEFRNKIKT